MLKYSWVLWFILVILLGILTLQNLNEKDGLREVIEMGGIQIGENQLWVEVSLEESKHSVTVRKGEEVIRTMPCSGGTKDEPTVLGVFYLENRGEWFYSERFKEGAQYWVRFYKQYLFHSVPMDRDFNVIKEEADKMGSAASHGCIRLLFEDSKWFYENIPDDTLVIIHD